MYKLFRECLLLRSKKRSYVEDLLTRRAMGRSGNRTIAWRHHVVNPSLNVPTYIQISAHRTPKTLTPLPQKQTKQAPPSTLTSTLTQITFSFPLNVRHYEERSDEARSERSICILKIVTFFAVYIYLLPRFSSLYFCYCDDSSRNVI